MQRDSRWKRGKRKSCNNLEQVHAAAGLLCTAKGGSPGQCSMEHTAAAAAAEIPKYKNTLRRKERATLGSVRWSTHQPLVQLLTKNTKKKYNLGAIIGQILYSAAGKIQKKKNTNTIFDGAHDLLSGGGAAAAICNFSV